MRLKRVYIEITNTCNLACSFCIQNQRQPRRMNIQEFTHVIQEVRSVTRHVYLHVLGEPLSHPDLPAFLQICKANDMEVILTTNGTLLKKTSGCFMCFPMYPTIKYLLAQLSSA